MITLKNKKRIFIQMLQEFLNECEKEMNQQDKLDYLNKYFTNKYEFLVEISFNCLKKIKKTNLANEQVNNLYLYLNQNLDKIIDNNIDYDKMDSICINWLNKQVVWQNTALKRENNDSIYINEIEIEIIEDEYDYEKDKEFSEKLNIIYQNLEKCDDMTKNLFEYFNQGINTSGKLAKYTKLSRTTCYLLIKEMKNNLKNGRKD